MFTSAETVRRFIFKTLVNLNLKKQVLKEKQRLQLKRHPKEKKRKRKILPTKGKSKLILSKFLLNARIVMVRWFKLGQYLMENSITMNL